MNQPSHILMSRLLHAIVFDIHHRDAARLAGDTLREADYQLDLDLMKKSYWQYHARETDIGTQVRASGTISGKAVRFGNISRPETYVRGAR